MSHHIISRFLKPIVYKHVLRQHKNVRLFSTPAYPYLLIDHILKTQDSEDGRFGVCSGSYFLRHLNEVQIMIEDKELVEEVQHTMTLGYHQSGVRFHLSPEQRSIRIHYQHQSNSKPVTIDLPPLPIGSQIQNLTMSSCPDLNNKDWVVAVKFSGSQIRLYRPNDESDRWIDVKTTPDIINPFSSLMYSKKDEKFYIPTPGGEHLCSLDLHFKEGDQPKFLWADTDDFSTPLMRELESLNSFLRTDHLVESPSGEIFLVKWYSGDSYQHFPLPNVMHITKRFMVFRTVVEQDDILNKMSSTMSYKEDIGDLCILLGYGEALCIPASSSPGLRPNCIYFVGYNFGVYDIAGRLCTTFFSHEGPLKSTELPYWPSPYS